MIGDSKEVAKTLRTYQHERQEPATATHSFVLQPLVPQVPSSVSRPTAPLLLPSIRLRVREESWNGQLETAGARLAKAKEASSV